jgi:hypothetical protein
MIANRPEIKKLIRLFADKPLTLSAYHAVGGVSAPTGRAQARFHTQ